MDGQQREHRGPTCDPAPPRLLFCHFPFGKDLSGIREYAAAHRYAGVEWSLDSWRMMVARSRRQQMIEQLRQAASFNFLHAPHTDLGPGTSYPGVPRADAEGRGSVLAWMERPLPQQALTTSRARGLLWYGTALWAGVGQAHGPGAHSTWGRRASASFTFSSGYS